MPRSCRHRQLGLTAKMCMHETYSVVWPGSKPPHIQVVRMRLGTWEIVHTVESYTEAMTTGRGRLYYVFTLLIASYILRKCQVLHSIQE